MSERVPVEDSVNPVFLRYRVAYEKALYLISGDLCIESLPQACVA